MCWTARWVRGFLRAHFWPHCRSQLPSPWAACVHSPPGSWSLSWLYSHLPTPSSTANQVINPGQTHVRGSVTSASLVRQGVTGIMSCSNTSAAMQCSLLLILRPIILPVLSFSQLMMQAGSFQSSMETLTSAFKGVPVPGAVPFALRASHSWSLPPGLLVLSTINVPCHTARGAFMFDKRKTQGCPWGYKTSLCHQRRNDDTGSRRRHWSDSQVPSSVQDATPYVTLSIQFRLSEPQSSPLYK